MSYSVDPVIDLMPLNGDSAAVKAVLNSTIVSDYLFTITSLSSITAFQNLEAAKIYVKR